MLPALEHPASPLAESHLHVHRLISCCCTSISDQLDGLRRSQSWPAWCFVQQFLGRGLTGIALPMLILGQGCAGPVGRMHGKLQALAKCSHFERRLQPRKDAWYGRHAGMAGERSGARCSTVSVVKGWVPTRQVDNAGSGRRALLKAHAVAHICPNICVHLLSHSPRHAQGSLSRPGATCCCWR